MTTVKWGGWEWQRIPERFVYERESAEMVWDQYGRGRKKRASQWALFETEEEAWDHWEKRRRVKVEHARNHLEKANDGLTSFLALRAERETKEEITDEQE